MGIKIRVRCHKCGELNLVNIEPVQANTICEITFVCSTCGALCTVSYDPNNPDPENGEWLCIPPQGFEWVLPAGKIIPVVGEPIYISAFGEHLSRKMYIERYKLDPEIAYQFMRKKRGVQTANETAGKLNTETSGKASLNLTNIKKIEVLCTNCGRINELSI